MHNVNQNKILVFYFYVTLLLCGCRNESRDHVACEEFIDFLEIYNNRKMLQNAYSFEIYATVKESTKDTRVQRAMNFKIKLDICCTRTV